MKKTLIAVAAAAALTTSAFAELSFGTWTNALFAPIANDGLNTVSNMGMSWGGTARTGAIDFHFKSEDDLAGMDFSYRCQANMKADVGDYSAIWVKPVDAVKLSLGKYDNNTLRGDVCYGSWNWLRPSAWIAGDEGLLMSGNGRTGALLEVTPVDGLYIQALLPLDGDGGVTETAEVFKNMQAGFAYNIEGVGKIKAQLLLSSTPKTSDATEALLDKAIEAEFDLTAVDNLWVGVGFRMDMVDKLDDRLATKADTQKMKIALGATYQVSDELKVSASGAYFTYQKAKSDNGQDGRFQAGFGVDYNLGDGMALAADVRYLAKAGIEKNDKTDRMAFSAGVTKSVGSNAMIGAAFQGITNSGNLGGISANASKKYDQENKDDKLVWAVPVRVSMWF